MRKNSNKKVAGKILSARNVSLSYGPHLILDEVSFDVQAGDKIGLVGPNGCGKSTLLRVCAMLEAPDAGSIRFTDAGNELQQDLALRRRMTLVFPKTTVFRGSVFDNAAYGLRIRGANAPFVSERVEEALVSVGLIHKVRQDARTLSSGESQRLGIARALALKPDVLFLDEPTASVDEEHTAFIEDLIMALDRQTATTIIMTTHDRHQAEKIAGRLVAMRRGVVVEDFCPLRNPSV